MFYPISDSRIGTGRDGSGTLRTVPTRSMKEDGGTVTIATLETDEDFRVIISDDGVGFDIEEAKMKQETQSDGKSHVGMENTRRRIADLCGGSVMIESTPGEGTVATVILPKSGQTPTPVATE